MNKEVVNSRRKISDDSIKSSSQGEKYGSSHLMKARECWAARNPGCWQSTAARSHYITSLQQRSKLFVIEKQNKIIHFLCRQYFKCFLFKN